MAVHLNAFDKQMHTVAFNLGDSYESALPWNTQALHLGGFQQTEYHVVTLLECRCPVHHHFERVAHRGCSQTCK